MELFGLATVVSITVICYLAGLAVKQTTLDSKWIPTIVGALGGLLGALGMRVIADFPAANVIDAIAVGIASGLAATGIDQVGKQLGGK